MSDYTRKDLPHVVDTLRLIEKRKHMDDAGELAYKRFKNYYRRITGKKWEGGE
jgi:hypothetical protein